MKTHLVLLTSLLLTSALAATALEKLDRGTVALTRGDGSIYVGWRLRLSDAPNLGFEVFRARTDSGAGRKLTDKPITDSCNFVDPHPSSDEPFYAVAPAGTPPKASDYVRADSTPYRSLKLVSKGGAQKVGLADFNGDGKLDYLVKQPDFNTDPYQQPGY